MQVAQDLYSIVQLGLSDEERRRLGISNDDFEMWVHLVLAEGGEDGGSATRG